MSQSTTADRQTDQQTALIDRLLAERTQMLVAFCGVAGLEPFRPDRQALDLLQRFCQILIDYSALWHFEVYESLSHGRKDNDPAMQAALQVYPTIVAASEYAVNFSDRYDESTHELDTSALEQDLGDIGKMLAARIEAEDQVLAILQGE